MEVCVAASSNIGIKSFGAYIPRHRMVRSAIAAAHAWALPGLKGLAKGEKSMCSWDEDAITMAVEAGRDCLRGQKVHSLSSITLASITAPYADLQNAVVVAAALGADKSLATTDCGGSVRAGLDALTHACRSGGADQLIVASDRRSAKPGSAQEMLYGSGAGALLIGSGDDLTARFVGSHAVSVPFFDHFRQSSEHYDYFWEERWIRDEGIAKLAVPAIQALLEKTGRDVSQIAHFGLSGGPANADKLVARKLSLDTGKLLPDLRGEVGDTGSAHPVLQLIAALERAQPGDLIVITSFAQGCQVVAFEMQNPPADTGRRGLTGTLARRIEENTYLKMLSFDGELQLDWGMRAETDQKTALTQLYRSADQIFAFVGGKCDACGAVQFPRLPSCVNCGQTDSQKPYALVDEPAKVATFTADWLQYTPAPPLHVGLVQFDSGARLLMEMVDVGSAGIEVGTPLEMTFRIKERDRLRHFDRYFWKATPTQ